MLGTVRTTLQIFSANLFGILYNKHNILNLYNIFHIYCINLRDPKEQQQTHIILHMELYYFDEGKHNKRLCLYSKYASIYRDIENRICRYI